jgi:hypothetical protein
MSGVPCRLSNVASQPPESWREVHERKRRYDRLAQLLKRVGAATVPDMVVYPEVCLKCIKTGSVQSVYRREKVRILGTDLETAETPTGRSGVFVDWFP